MKKIIVVFSCLILLFSCSNKKINSDSLNIATYDFVSSLDPAFQDVGIFLLRWGIGETLFKLDESNVPQPLLANSYKQIDDLTWQITLKDNIYFADGTPLTLEMVVKNLQRIAQLNKKGAFLLGSTFTIDGQVLTIKTASSHPNLINDLCESYSIIINLDSDKSYILSPITTGPYQVNSFNEKNELSLVANQHYWLGKPLFKEVKIVKADIAKLSHLKSANLDVYVGFKDINLNDNKYVLEEGSPYLNLLFYNLNLSPNLREVISLVSNIAKKETNIATLWDVFNKEINVEDTLSKAKELLSGYSDEDGDGYLDENGHKLKIKIVLSEDEDKQIKAYIYELQKILISLGIACDSKEVNNVDMLTLSKYDLYLFKTLPKQNGTYNSLLTALLSEGGAYNFNEFTSFATNELLKMLNSVSFNESDDIINDILLKLQQSNVLQFLSLTHLKLIKSNNLTNFSLNSNGYYLLNNLSAKKK